MPMKEEQRKRGAGCIPQCNDEYPCVMDDTCPGPAERERKRRKQSAAKGRATAARNKLKRQVEEIQKESRFHRWAADHHTHKAWEVEADLVKMAVDVFNEAKLEQPEGTGTFQVADDLTARLGSWNCPPNEEDYTWLRENHTDEEWEKYLARVALNPLGYCVYDDPNNDFCLFCGLPSERK